MCALDDPRDVSHCHLEVIYKLDISHRRFQGCKLIVGYLGQSSTHCCKKCRFTNIGEANKPNVSQSLQLQVNYFLLALCAESLFLASIGISLIALST